MKAYYNIADIPLVLTVEDLMPILKIGRNAAYKLVRSEQIRSIKVGHKIRIPKEAVLEYLGIRAA